MSGAFFYIEYKNGSVTQIEFNTVRMARKIFNSYATKPEDNVKSYGWDTKYDVPTLAQQIRAKKVVA